jgi:hypothetical protein
MLRIPSLSDRGNVRFARTIDVAGRRHRDMRPFATILALSFAAAGTLEDAAALYERGDYATALQGGLAAAEAAQLKHGTDDDACSELQS